ncbi:MAG: hypothetical protein K2V38_07730, partial [Gemmataceae bacterium]|nr:hypothetical protein [Gemmataceae bacterium]
FWQALDKVCAAAGLVVYSNYEDGTLTAQNQDARSPHVSYAGPFKITATNIQTSRSVQLSNLGRGGQNAQHENTYLSLQIDSEPKNPMMGVGQAELIAATDDRGGSLAFPRNRNDDLEYRSTSYYSRGSRMHSASLSLNLNRTDRSATQVKTLQAKVRVELLSGTSAEVTVPDVLKVKKQTFTGTTTDLYIESVEEDANNKGVYLVHLTAKNRTPPDPRRGDDYMWANNLPQRLELMDANGARYHSYGQQESEFNNGSYRMKVMFGPDDRRWGRPGPAKLGPPAKLVLTQWHTVTHEVTFDLKDIPLP